MQSLYWKKFYIPKAKKWQHLLMAFLIRCTGIPTTPGFYWKPLCFCHFLPPPISHFLNHRLGRSSSLPRSFWNIWGVGFTGLDKTQFSSTSILLSLHKLSFTSYPRLVLLAKKGNGPLMQSLTCTGKAN